MSRTKSSGCRSSGAEWEPFVLTAAQPPVEEWGAAALVPYSQKLEPNAPLRNATHHTGRVTAAPATRYTETLLGQQHNLDGDLGLHRQALIKGDFFKFKKEGTYYPISTFALPPNTVQTSCK